jgi:hypothetical protein
MPGIAFAGHGVFVEVTGTATPTSRAINHRQFVVEWWDMFALGLTTDLDTRKLAAALVASWSRAKH